MKNNILILSAGSRVELVKYFKNEFKNEGNVVCCDRCEYAPTLYVADRFYIVPSITSPDYLDTILDICEKESIKGVFSLIDPELLLLSKNKSLFEEKGIKVFVSDFKTVQLCNNKYVTSKKLQSLGLPYIKSFETYQEVVEALQTGVVSFPLFQKPVEGSASIGIKKVNSLAELDNDSSLLYQQYMNGQEYGVDVFIDYISKEVVDIFVKKKVLMRSGETDKSISIKNEALVKNVLSFVRSLDFRGQIDIDVFEYENEYYISEVNPRFGGGYLHAYVCGVNFPKYILNNLKNNCNESFKALNYDENIAMMKYVSLVTYDMSKKKTE